MMFIANMVVNIPVLKGKPFSMDCACTTMDPIINIRNFLYGTKCNVDLILSLSALMFLYNDGLCSPSAYVCSVDGTRSDSTFLNSLSA